MRLTLDSIVVLDAIDRAGSFAGGAEQLYRVPSAVSYSIHKLEQDLGVRIFDRSGHRAKLTNAGTQLLKDGRMLLRLAAEAELKAKRVHAGWESRLSIGVADVLPKGAVYPLLTAFYDAPGHGSTLLHVSTETQSRCWHTLLDGRSDLVIGAPEPGPSVQGYRTQKLGEVQLALVVPATHALAGVKEPLSAETFASYRLVTQNWPLPQLDESSEEMIAIDDYQSQVEAIRHGVGIGLVPSYLVYEDVKAGRLVIKTVVDAPKLRLVAAW